MGTLHDSNVCRLCATDSEDGFLLFGQNGKDEICTLINKYLPIEVSLRRYYAFLALLFYISTK